ncbi:MAG TPA: efflux transporter outer membrane subunit [Steroidobacteraceae bacterium]|nr:efflux transporter outer membrane subunit [Steroidobacteraceae bacterium]
MSRVKYVGCVAAVLLGGCSLAPKYRPPPPPEVTNFKEAGDWMPAAPSDTAPRGAWWEPFGEPTLNDLERQLAESNPDLQAAVARFQEARGVAIRARSDIFPTVGADVSATRGKSSTNAPLSRALNATPGTSNDFIAGLNLNWEVDLFGRLRNASAAANAQAQASAADLAAVELSLQAELASDFFSLRGDDTTIQLLEDTIKVYDRAFELTRNRYKEGISAATDVDQADTLRQNARSQLAAVRLERAQLEHAIAVLLGHVPSGFSLDPGELAGSPPPVDAGLPSKLLERRPDVSRAERTMAAANAQIGVAKAAWFPVFSLAGAGGFESILSSSWFNAPSHFWSVGPSASVPLLDAGARYGLNKQARAQYDEAAATYRKTTLTAYQEVEDNLAGLHHLADQRRADEAAASSAQSSAYHADQRYDAGVADYVEVTTTHTAALNAQRDTISVRVAQMNASVALVRATGGGWTQAQLETAAVMP